MATKRKKLEKPTEESNFDFSKQKSKEVALFKFSKQQLVSSKKYSINRDVLNALLKDGQVYTFKEVDQLLNDFLKGKVNE